MARRHDVRGRPDPGRDGWRPAGTHHYRFRNQAGARTITLGARIVDGRLEGTLSATEHFDDPAYGAYACQSGALTFSARPQR